MVRGIMSATSTLAATRFGTGLSPTVPPPSDAAAILSRLAGPDTSAAKWPIPTYSAAHPNLVEMNTLLRAVHAARGQGHAAEAAARLPLRDAYVKARALRAATLQATLVRGAAGDDGFRERLTWFWADHFTTRAKNGKLQHLVTPYVEETIRPNMAGSFASLLRAVVTAPMMLMYLDQVSSIGPDSPVGRRSDKGLNENLARELMELHTLGVDAGYTQDDVREMAQLLTGLSYTAERGFFYAPARAEPGAETVMGVTYGAASNLATVYKAIDDLAVHPATAHHISTKLARHFVADDPDPALVAAMVAAFIASDGDLPSVYAAMLDHPASWVMPAQKVKRPLHFVVSALRALEVAPERLLALDYRLTQRLVVVPMGIMGQAWEQPTGPNGWPDEAAAWLTAQGIAARINWSMQVPAQLRDVLPDPRDFATVALGPDIPDTVRFAAAAAETRADGVALVLLSPAFQRS